MKIQQGYGKWILRQLLHRYVPQSLVDRPKAGFKLPLCEWIRGPLRAWADELLEPELLADQGYFDVNIVSDAYQNHLSGKQERHYHLWNILMFQSWLKSWKSDGVL
jgi:asparagine synthase (glutamine-hydrolysing)